MKKNRQLGLKLDVQVAQQVEDYDQSIEKIKNHSKVEEKPVTKNFIEQIELSKIDNLIYISNWKTAMNIELLHKENITHVVNLIGHKQTSLFPIFDNDKNQQQQALSPEEQPHMNSRKQGSFHFFRPSNQNASQNFFQQDNLSKEKVSKQCDFNFQNSQQASKDMSSIKCSLQLKEQQQQQAFDKEEFKQRLNQSSRFNFGGLQNSFNDNFLHKNSQRNQIEYLKLEMRDQVDCDISYFVYSAIEFIENAIKQKGDKAKVLIHCYKGNSRSAVVAAAYYMYKQGMGAQEAIDFIRQKRGFIDPNIGFVGQLIAFQDRLRRIKAQNIQNSPTIFQKKSSASKTTSQQRQPFMKDYLQSIQVSFQETKQVNNLNPRIFVSTITKKMILSKSFSPQEINNDQILFSPNNQIEKNQASISSQEIQNYIESQGNVALIQTQTYFMILVNQQNSQQGNQGDTISDQKGVLIFLKLAQLLSYYEHAPQLCYVFTQKNEGMNEVKPALMRIQDIQRLQIKLNSVDDQNNQVYEQSSYRTVAEVQNSHSSIHSRQATYYAQPEMF